MSVKIKKFSSYIPYKFESYVEQFESGMEMLKKYVGKKQYLPVIQANDDDLERQKLILWIKTQRDDFDQMKGAMKHALNRKEWLHFYLENIELFNSIRVRWLPKEHMEWLDWLAAADRYIYTNKKLPSYRNKETGLARWIHYQKIDFKLNQAMMTYPEICGIWMEFMKRYPSFFPQPKDLWYTNFKTVSCFIEKNGRLPDSKKSPEECKLSEWIRFQIWDSQNKKYIMEENMAVCATWKSFVMKHHDLFCEFI